MKHYTPALCTFFLGAPLLMAQDFSERFAPKELPNSSVRQTTLQAGGKKIEASQDKTVIVPALQGIKVLTSPEAVSTKALTKKGLSLPEEAILQQAAFQELLSAHLNQPLSMGSLSQLRGQIVQYYRAQNVPVVDVLTPEQDITHGVLQILVIEGRVNAVHVTGNEHFSNDFVQSNVQLEEGGRIDSKVLLDDVNWVNKNPFINVQPVFAAGEKAHSTDVVLQVNDARPWRAYIGYENSGNELTGTNRYLVGFNAGNVLGKGHQLNYQLTFADEFDELNAHSLSYVVPLPWRHLLQVHAAYVDTSVATGPFDIDGRNRELGARYTVPLAGTETLNHEVYGGLVWRNLDNALEFGVIPAANNSTHIGQFEFGYKGSKQHAAAITHFDFSFTYSPGDLFGDSTDADFSASRAGAENNYVYARLNLSHLHKLPKSFTWSSELTAQWSDARLLGSEQLSVGGYSSVRGYDEREFNGTDTGFVWRNELRSPDVNLIRKGFDQWQFLVFSDYAWSNAHNGQITQADGSLTDNGELWSAGVGTRIKLGDRFTVRADYGFQLKDVNSDRSNGRFHLGGIYSF